ncbi:MAG: ferritin family protein [Cetobacterium sp.]|uniref:ferritin family protein n=1 Tax=Cetobacterium sp. TaxID=2071632 RepID=UPI003F2DC59B
MEYIKSRTYENVINAYRGEISGEILYELLSQRALEEGYSELVNVFKQISKEEKGHGNILKKFIPEDISKYELSSLEIDNLKNIPQQTIKNLEIFSSGEKKAGEETYPKYSEIAKEEGYEDIGKIFSQLAELEIKHGIYLEEQLAKIK